MAEPTRSCEVLVIGGGPGGYHAAIRAAQLGREVVCVDEGTFGGVCLHRGCIPSKGLIGIGKLVEKVRKAEAMGVHAKGVEVDLVAAQAWKKRQIETLAKGVESLMRARGVTVVTGRAVLSGPDTATVGAETIRFQHCILAPGSRSVELPHLRFDGERVIGSRHALELTRVPRSVLVVGGGFIGLELGQFLHQLGAEVTVVEMLPRLLPTADEELSSGIERSLTRRGMVVKTRTKAAAAEAAGAGLRVTLEGPDGARETAEFEKVLVAVGRRANTAGLGLEAAGVKADARGVIQVDAALRTSNPRVLAIGDAVPGPALAHKAMHEGLVAAEVVSGRDSVVDYRALPWFCYTTPEVAAVGLTEAEAKEAYGEVRVGRFQFAGLGKAKMMGETEGFVKVVATADDVIVGVHIVGEQAATLIAEAALAIEMGATADDVAWTIHAHPTLPEAFLEAVEGLHGRGIHSPK